MENKILKVSDKLTTREDHKIGLHGHVQVFVEDRDTGKVSLWDEDDNVICISGAQWILMKMFGLYLDTSHAKDYENISRDTNLVIPDLNSAAGENIGIDPANYSRMEEDISDAHFIQGFMVGNIRHLGYHEVEKFSQRSLVFIVPFGHGQQHIAGENHCDMRIKAVIG